MKLFWLLSILFCNAESASVTDVVSESFKDTIPAYINYANNMIAAYKETINGANKIFPTLINRTAIEQLKAWPNLIRQLEPLYAVCKVQVELLGNTLYKLATIKNDGANKDPVILYTQSDLNGFKSGMGIVISGDINFSTSAANLIATINAIITDPETTVNGEKFETTYSSLVKLGEAFNGLENGNSLVAQGNEIMYNISESQLISLQKFPQSKQFLTLLYSQTKALFQSCNEIASVIKEQYNSYVKMNNMMNMNPNAKMGSMCQYGMEIIVGNTSEQVVAIIEKLLNAMQVFKTGLESLSS